MLAYNNSQDVIGHYLYIRLINLYDYIQFHCNDVYFSHILNNLYYLEYISILLLYIYWTIAYHRKYHYITINISIYMYSFICSSSHQPIQTNACVARRLSYSQCSTKYLNDIVYWFHNDTILSTTTIRMLILPAVLTHNLGLYTCRSRSDNITSDPFWFYSKGILF